MTTSIKHSHPGRRLAFAACLLAAAAFAPGNAARADITFNFTFTDPAGMGLNDPAYASARAAVISDGIRLGSLFSNTATVTIAVGSENDPNSGTLASAGSQMAAKAGFNRTVVQQKILGGTDINGAAPDGQATINLAQPFQYNANTTVGANQYDFTSTFMHELTHTLGFTSSIGSAPGMGPASYSVFDSFLTNGAGSLLINPSTFTFDPSKVGALTGGNNTLLTNPNPNGEFFGGANAKAALNGQLIPIYSPNPYQDGSSGSHTDDFSAATAGQLMNAAVGTGPAPRAYSAIEMGILEDIGYSFNMVAVPEPATWMGGALLIGMAGATLRRRNVWAA